ncbi:MAG: oligosaccharide flippase family protein [ANME-2 cluster archaeon]|nr:oligosaccharide flippase family protein [ANME-2 cluster archaeon]
MNSEAHITARNAFKVLYLRVSQFPILLLFVLIIPRMMGPELYGKYAFMSSLLIILSMFTGLGTIEIFGRFIPELKSKNEIPKIHKLFSNTLFFKIIFSTIISITFFLIFYFFTPEGYDRIYFLIIAVALLIYGIEGTLYAFLFGLNEMGKFTSRDLLRRIFSLVFIIVMFKYFELFGAILAILLIELALLSFAIIWSRKYLHFEKFDFHFLKPYLKFGLLFFLSSSLLIFSQRFGNLLIQFISQNPNEIAFFDIANQIFLINSMFFFFLFSSFIPIFTTLLIKNREDKIQKWSSIILKNSGIICMFVLISILLVGSDLINLIFGIEYKKVIINLIVLYFGIFPLLVAQIGIIFSIVYNKPKKYLIALSFAIITFLINSFLFIPKYGSVGCSIATVCSSIVFGLAMYIQFRKNISSYALKDSMKIFVIGLLFIPFIFFKGNIMTNLLLVILFVIIFSIILFKIGILNINEIKEIIDAIIRHPNKTVTIEDSR